MSSQRQIYLQEIRLVKTQLDIDWTKIYLNQFRRGLEVELEHSAHDSETNVSIDNLTLTGKSVWLPLKELRDYYTRLQRLEAEARDQA